MRKGVKRFRVIRILIKYKVIIIKEYKIIIILSKKINIIFFCR
jgi:hypothetical protein